jgi:DNA-binding LacI/PurR family transcriptional regulator
MKLIIYRNEDFEEEEALFDLESKRVIMSGDYYHNKINERINGYLQALADFDIYDKEVGYEWIDSSHEHYSLLDFDS